MNGFHARSIRSLTVAMARPRPEARSARPRLSILVSLLTLGAFTASCNSSQTSNLTAPTPIASLASHSGNVDLPVPVVSDAGVCGQLTLTWTNVAVDGHIAQSWHLEIWELVLGVRVDPKVFNDATYVGNPTPESLTLTLPAGTYEVRITAKSSLSGVKNSANASYFFTVTACSSEACSPGFWKQPHHVEDWPAPLGPGTTFASVFGRVITIDPPGSTDPITDPTLQQVLTTGGGDDNRTARIGTAAYLSALHADVAYPYTTAQVITAVQNAIDDVADPAISIDDLENVWKDNPGHCPLGDDPGGDE